MITHAIITGAASGIGLATAQRLAADGWTVTGIDKQARPDTLSSARWLQCDLADSQSVAETVASLASQRADALILCAGVAGVGSVEQVLRVNFLANRQLLDGLGPGIRDGGSISLMSSGAGWRWSEHSPILVRCISTPEEDEAIALAATGCATPAEAYVRSKELLCAMAARRCLEQWHRGVRLNSVSPGGVETPLIPDFTASMGQEAMDFASALVGRHASASEVAEVVAFLCSPNARWINGADIRVDGGLVGALASGAADFRDWNS